MLREQIDLSNFKFPMIQLLNKYLPEPLAICLWLVLGSLSFVAQAQDDELLPSDEAFAFKADINDSGIQASWTIAEGYYMYRDKLSFALADSSGNPIQITYDFPPSKTKADPAFGDVEVYFKKVEFSIPASSADKEVLLTVKGQGCNEPIGVCYPPITHKLPLTLISSAAASTPGLLAPDPAEEKELESISELRDLLGGGQAVEDELLPPDEAFKVDAIVDRGSIVVRYDIADGYYLYQNKLKYQSETHQLTPPALPAGESKHDEYFGDVIVYKHQFDAILNLADQQGGDKLALELGYQGCAEAGVCYPPQKKNFELAVGGLISSASAQDTTALPASTDNTAEESDNSTLWWVLITAFAAGFGLTFTPCVLPLIPILSSVIAGQGESVTKSKAAWLSGVYVLGTAVTYAAIGAVAGATGEQLQAYFQNVWAIGTLAFIFFLMSLSMFGLYDIQMPSFIQSRMAEKSQGIKGGSTPMVFVLGLLSALIVGACVSPVLISFLSIAIAKGSASLGALIMFAMAAGMGIPLIILGMGAGHLLPKAGMWMDKVKYVFGVLLLGVAIYMLSVLPAVPVLFLWAALFIIVAIYLGATQSLPEGASGWQKLFKGIGTMLLIWGILALIGAMYGERDITHPLPETLFSAAPTSSAGPQTIEKQHLFTRVNNLEELDQQLAAAVGAGKGVMLDYYADWCTDCIRMEKTTFEDAAVLAELNAGFVALQVDVTDPNDEDRKALKKRYGVFGPPAILFFNAQGEQLKDKSFYGYKDAEAFLQHLRSI